MPVIVSGSEGATTYGTGSMSGSTTTSHMTGKGSKMHVTGAMEVTGTLYVSGNTIYNYGGFYNLQGNVGIGTTSPGTNLQIESTSPYMTLKNSTAENSAGGCESKLIFEDHGNNALGQIEVSHVGSSNDEKGQLIFKTNNDSGLQTALTISEAQLATFAGSVSIDGVTISAIQGSGESFADNDTSLMTSAAIDDRINTAVTAEDLDVAADSGTAAVDLNSQSLTVTGGTGITTSATGQAVTVNVDAASPITSVTGDFTVTGGDVTVGAAGNTTATTIGTIVNTGTNAGKALTVSAGSSTTGANDINGGNLILKSGGGDGTGTSEVQIWTKTNGTDAATQKLTVDAAGDVASIIDGAALKFGANNEITLTHEHDVGLILEGNGVTACPVLTLKNTNDDATGGTLKFLKDGTNVADSDVVGNIDFVSEDDGGGVHTYVRAVGSIDVDAAGQESGKLSLQVTTHDGGAPDNGLVITGGSAEHEVDVVIGNGAASSTTAAGDLTVTTDLTVNGAATLGDAATDIIAVTGRLTGSTGAMFNGPILSQVGSSGGDGIVVTHTDADKQGIAISSTNPTTGAPFVVDHNDSATSAVTPTSMVLDFDKSGVTGDGVTSRYTGFDINMADGATNHTNAKVYITGSSINVSSANNAGHTINTGLEVTVAGGDSNYAALFKSGYVGIGTEAPSFALAVADNNATNLGGSAGASLGVFNSNNNAANAGIFVSCGKNSPAGDNQVSWLVLADGDSTPVAYINYVHSGPTAAFVAASDKRIKTDIAPTKVDALEILNNIPLSEFRVAKKGKEVTSLNRIGFVAQDCESAWPEMVSEINDEDYDHKLKAIAPSTLIPVLVKAIQELAAEVKLLKGE